MEARSVETQPVEDEVVPWSDEPTTLDSLNDAYIVEAKVTGRSAGTTIYLVQSKQRGGAAEQVEEGQQYKLFLAS